MFDKKKLIQLIFGAIVLVVAFILKRKTGEGYISLVIFLIAYLALGGDVILRALKNIFRGQIFDENFLMSIATIGAFAIGEYAEAAGVMLFYEIGELFQDAAVKKSKRSISDLMDIRPDYANLIKNAAIEKVAPETVNVGDLILVKPGEKIPLDGIVTEGQSFLDASALTGESVPKNAKVDDTVLSGYVNQTGVLTVKVIKTFGESTASKIINLVENASSRKAKTENFITIFARYYTPVVVALAILLAILPPLFIGGFAFESSVLLKWLHRALVFLVISCPCALVLSIPMSFFAGIGRAARSGILVKGGNYLEAFNNLETVVFDKTGTLTKGVFKVMDIQPASGFSAEELLELAAYAEAFSNHPIAKSIRDSHSGTEAQSKEIDKSKLSDYTEISGLGVSVKLGDKIIYTGNDKLMQKNNIAYKESLAIGTKVYVALSSYSVPPCRCESKFAGTIIISDEIKPDSRQTISALKSKGVQKIIMLTGDNPQIAKEIAEELGIDEVYAALLPHEKVEKVEALNTQKSSKGKFAFIGDGINDAPVLAMADIGIAMGALGSDAAIEAADVVLMTDEPSKLTEAIDIARFTKKIVWQNIVFALGIKSAFLVLGAFGIAGMWEAVFADAGVALLAVLNAMRIINIRQTLPFVVS